jgi:hypothetical protein
MAMARITAALQSASAAAEITTSLPQLKPSQHLGRSARQADDAEPAWVDLGNLRLRIARQRH